MRLRLLLVCAAGRLPSRVCAAGASRWRLRVVDKRVRSRSKSLRVSRPARSLRAVTRSFCFRALTAVVVLAAVASASACSSGGESGSVERAAATTGPALAVRLSDPADMAKFCKTELFTARYRASVRAVDVGLNAGPVEDAVETARQAFPAGDSRFGTLSSMMRAAAQVSEQEAIGQRPPDSHQLIALVNSHDAADVDACAGQFNPSAVPTQSGTGSSGTAVATPQTRRSRTTTATAAPTGPAGPTCIKSFAAIIDGVTHGDYPQVYALDAAPDKASRAKLDEALTAMFDAVTNGTTSNAQAADVAVDAMRPYCSAHPTARARRL